LSNMLRTYLYCLDKNYWPEKKNFYCGWCNIREVCNTFNLIKK
jgi:hypothetical protein